MLEEHVCGYTQRKRLLDAVKERQQKFVDIETQVIIRASVKGKSTMDRADQLVYDNHTLEDLKEKVQMVTIAVQTAIDEGRVTQEEKPLLLESLNNRLSAAEGKPKLQEKLKNMISSVTDAAPYTVPVADVLEIKTLKNKIKGVKELEDKPKDSLTDYERKKIEEKPEVKEAIRKLEENSRMWFETAEEFKIRLDKALQNATFLKLEQKRLESMQKKQEQGNNNSTAAAKKKGKRAFAKVDVFSELRDQGFQAREDREDMTGDNTEAVLPSPEASPEASPSASPRIDAKASPAESEINQASDSAPKLSNEQQECTEDDTTSNKPLPPDGTEEPSDDNPSVVAAKEVKAASGKKIPPPQPKKKEKKKLTKMDPTALGFK